MSNILTFKIPDSWNSQTIIAEISKHFLIKKNPIVEQRQTCFDTFDWRLFTNGYYLIQEEEKYYLSSTKTEALVEKPIGALITNPKFWWDFPEGTFKDMLKKYLDIRALIPLFEIEIKVDRLLILNNDQKTVVRVQFENIYLIQQGRANEFTHCIKLRTVRGYDQEFVEIKKWLNELGIIQETKAVFLLVLEAIGKKPGDYSSKLNVTLSPDMTVREATIIILKYLLHIIQLNVAGIKEDIDTEFLHDFRVAIRRTRSTLSQIKGVFPKEIRDRFKNDLAVLQKTTNRLRDLDVYLLNKENYQQMLPDHLRPGLEPLFDQLRLERKEEHKNIVNVLCANSYTKTIESWEAFLNSIEEQPETKNSHKPVIDLSRKFIFKAYNQVIQIGNQIRDYSPASELHQLRIECKKLRYLLEFFASLFPEQEISLLVKQLKRLQDNLGDYNDLSVQQRSLKKYLETIASEYKDSQQTVAAIGGLIASLFQQQQSVRKALAQTFTEFSEQDNEKIYQKLFA